MAYEKDNDIYCRILAMVSLLAVTEALLLSETAATIALNIKNMLMDLVQCILLVIFFFKYSLLYGSSFIFSSVINLTVWFSMLTLFVMVVEIFICQNVFHDTFLSFQVS